MVLTVLLPIGLALAAYFTVSRTKADVGNTTQGQLYFSNTVDTLASYTDEDVKMLEGW